MLSDCSTRVEPHSEDQRAKRAGVDGFLEDMFHKGSEKKEQVDKSC